ncbi:WXG100 family type VII secretion target [Mycobacterium hubeiense]|uniref:WXG100 family type VII secretion target n=1 Tax=Mycobacterium hubeiense TaxID=1867256 RepID=UPI000C7ED7B6|nr:WXG100 family type VII secretion target [Mycobacterium sp. QGD 101]
MAESIKYNFPAIAAAASNITANGGKLETLLSDMDASVRTRLQEAWQGEGGESYQQIAMRWNNAALEVRQALAQLGAATAGAGEGMSHTNRANAARFALG